MERALAGKEAEAFAERKLSREAEVRSRGRI
jgi:hypothetical protein